MKKSLSKLAAALMVVALCVTVLVSCGQSKKSALIGNWSTDVIESGATYKMTYSFNEDGTGKMTASDGANSPVDLDIEYSVDGNQLTYYNVEDNTQTITVTYGVDGDTLTITTSETSFKFTRQ